MKVILFDFFGVLSTPAYKKVIEKHIQSSQQKEWFNKLDILDVGGLSENDLASQIAQQAGVSLSDIWLGINTSPQLNETLFDFIEYNLKGNYVVGLLTNAPRSLIERLIGDRLSLFDIVLISSDLKCIKPSREIFEIALNRAQCDASEILFIDDGIKNIEAAQSLGFNGIVYTEFEQFKKDLARYL